MTDATTRTHVSRLTYIHTCRSYVHTPRDIFERRISIVTFTSAHLYDNAYMRMGVARTLDDFWLLGEQSSQKREIPCLGRRRTAVQNVTPLALSSAEKSVTVKTHKKHKQVRPSSRTDVYPHMRILRPHTA